MNKTMLIGRIVRDPEVRYSQGEKPMCVARYTLAVTRKFKSNGQSADFINCVAMGKNGDFAEKYLKKGMQIAIEGHIQTGSYTNKDGQKVYTTDVIVDSHEFTGSKAESNTSSNEAVTLDDSTNNSTSSFMDIPDSLDDDSLPFN